MLFFYNLLQLLQRDVINKHDRTFLTYSNFASVYLKVFQGFVQTSMMIKRIALQLYCLDMILIKHQCLLKILRCGFKVTEFSNYFIEQLDKKATAN